MLESLFGVRKAFIGMVHLPPLPGSPSWGGDMAWVLAQATEDALALAQGGANGIIVENHGDAPFAKGRVEVHTVAAMTLAVKAVREAVSLPVGINVLRNDPCTGLGIAAVTGARFIRVNVLHGLVAAEEGLIEGDAHETLIYRRALNADVKIFADVHVKHAAPLGNLDIALAARATAYRGGADALVITGPVTGEPAAIEDLSRVKGVTPDVPVLVGSGVNEDNVEAFLGIADGVIVGTSLKMDAMVHNPVDRERVNRLARRIKALL